MGKGIINYDAAETNELLAYVKEIKEGGGINPDAPKDGNLYGQKNGEWTKAQEQLESGKNIKTLNGVPVLGEGNIDVAPTIGENGNWFINGKDTGKPAKGKDGADGVSLGEIALVQETGTESGSEKKVMSQAAVTKELTGLETETYPIKEILLLEREYNYSDVSQAFNMYGELSIPIGKYRVKTVSDSNKNCNFRIVYSDETSENFATTLNKEITITTSKKAVSYQIYIPPFDETVDVILTISTVSVLKEVEVDVKNKLNTKIYEGIYKIGIDDLNGGNVQSKNEDSIYSKELEPYGVLILSSDKEVEAGELYFTFDVKVSSGSLNGINIRVCGEKAGSNIIDDSIYDSIRNNFFTISNNVILNENKKAEISIQAGSSGAILEIKNIQFSKERRIYTDVNFSKYPQSILKTMAVKDDLLPYKPLTYINDKYYYTFGYPYARRLPNESINNKVLCNGSIFDSSSSNINKTFIDSGIAYYITKSKHIAGSVLYQEYDKNDKLLSIVLCNEQKADGLVTFSKNAAYILSNFFWGYRLEESLYIEKTSIGTIYEQDYYPYDEVLKKGYLPNPGVGATCWGYKDMPKDLIDTSVFDAVNAGVFYNRCGWYEVQKSEDDDCINGFNTYILERAMQKAIDNKKRCRIGIFYTDFPGKVGGHVSRDGKEIYYMFPDYIFEKLYNAEEYPLFLLQYSDSQDCYNAIIDWRNTWVQEEYRKLLTKFYNWLNQDAGNGIIRKKYVSTIEVRFWGKWGEGHNTEYYTEAVDYIDSDSMIKIVDMYKEIFKDVRLVAPIDGYNDKHKEFFEYYFSVQNEIGHFGRFADQIGSLQMAEANYGGHITLENLEYNKKLLETKNRAPMVGEILQQTDETLNMYMSYLIPGCVLMGFSSVRYDNYTGMERGKPKSYNSYAYDSFKAMFKTIYNFIGAHIYHLVKYAYIENNTLKLWLLLGNIGNCILYDKNWKLQVITRLNAEEVDVIDIDFDLSTILPSKDVLVPHSYECVSIKKELVLTNTDENLKIFIRIVDTDGISDNFYLSNKNRTAQGEYEIFYSR